MACPCIPVYNQLVFIEYGTIRYLHVLVMLSIHAHN